MKRYVCSLCGYSRGDVEKVVAHVTRDHPNQQATIRTVEVNEPPTTLEVQNGVQAVRRRLS